MNKNQPRADLYLIRLVKSVDGIVMPVALVLTLLLTLLGAGALVSSSTDLLTARVQREGKAAFYAAEGAIVYGFKELNAILSTTLAPTSLQVASIAAPSLPGFVFDSFSVVGSGVAVTKTITTGPYASLNSISTAYTITSQASGTDPDSGTVRLTQLVEDQLIPLFQFGVFYNGDLEIFPGPAMTFNGRVHSNANIYVAPGAGNTLTFDSRISSGGDIYRCRKDSPSACGSAQIRKANGSYAPLSYDHNHTDWATKAYQDWEGLVQDSGHGVQKLNLPIGTANPIDLIKRGDTINPADSTESATLQSGRMYWQADLRILDGVAYNKSGSTVTLDVGVATTKTLYDYREAKVITVREVDIGLLGACACRPANGILYISETQDAMNTKSVRLVNGTTLPTGGLTVVSDNPMYIKGNYNTNTKKGAALMGDAMTFLSSNWKDASDATPYTASTALTSRGAAATTVNAAAVTGNTNTSVGGYNGGLENLPRFLENWSGVNFTYRGSLIDLWNSQQHATQWKGTGSTANVYNPPVRVWSYDTDFNNPANLPPGTPRVRILARIQWARM